MAKKLELREEDRHLMGLRAEFTVEPGDKWVALTPEKLRELRKGAGLTQRQLAIELGVSRRTVQRWEAGRRRPLGSRLLHLLMNTIGQEYTSDNPYILMEGITKFYLKGDIVTTDEEGTFTVHGGPFEPIHWVLHDGTPVIYACGRGPWPEGVPEKST